MRGTYVPSTSPVNCVMRRLHVFYHPVYITVSDVSAYEIMGTPQSGPWKLDLSVQPASSRLQQTFDTIVLFAVVHYIQIFWSGLFLLLYLFHIGIRAPLIAAASVYIPLYLIPFQRLGGRPWKSFMYRPFWRW